MARTGGRHSVRLVFQTILVGYDGPERGGEATALAEVLRDPRTGTLLLTSAYPLASLMVGGFVVPEEIEDLGGETKAMLAEARDALRAPARVQLRAVPSDSPARAVTEVAEAEHADLVVVGSSHRSALGRLLPGTTAERLLHDAPCPVAVAPRGYSGGEIRRVAIRRHDRGRHRSRVAFARGQGARLRPSVRRGRRRAAGAQARDAAPPR